MEDNITFLDDSIDIIMRQTDYTKEKTKEKLKEFNNDYLAVIKDYFGIPEKKTQPIKSVNQEIYKQIRYSLDQPMKEYRQQNPVNIDQVITNLQESEEREREREKDKNK